MEKQELNCSEFDCYISLINSAILYTWTGSGYLFMLYISIATQCILAWKVTNRLPDAVYNDQRVFLRESANAFRNKCYRNARYNLYKAMDFMQKYYYEY